MLMPQSWGWRLIHQLGWQWINLVWCLWRAAGCWASLSLWRPSSWHLLVGQTSITSCWDRIMTLILGSRCRSPWQPHPSCHAQYGLCGHKDKQYQEMLNLHRSEVEASVSDGFVFDRCTDCMCLWFSCSSSVAWCSVKQDAAPSSLSGAVGGPVWLNGQSMKPLLAGFLILKMYRLIVLWATLKASTAAAKDPCHATILRRFCRWVYYKFSVFGPEMSSLSPFLFLFFLPGSHVWDWSWTAVVSKKQDRALTSTSVY